MPAPKPTIEDLLKYAGVTAEQHTETWARFSFRRPLRTWSVIMVLKAGRLVISAYVMQAPIEEPRQAHFLKRIKAINAEIGGEMFTMRDDHLTIETKHRMTYTDAVMVGSLLRYVCDHGEKFYPSLLAIAVGPRS
jgi:hypothetical protein